jgi:chromosome segregation ATPase
MPFVIFLGVVVLVAAWRLNTRYEYSQKAGRALLALAAAAMVASVLFNLWLFPGLNLLYLVLAVTGVFLPLYSVVALTVVEIWRKRKQAAFDTNLASLRQQEEQLLEAVSHWSQRMQIAEHKRQTLELVHQERLGDQRRIREFLDRWEQGDGLTRVRSMKIQEWREAFAALSAADLEARREALRGQLRVLEAEAGDSASANGTPAAEISERVDQVRAQLSVASLLALRPVLGGPNEQLAALERQIDEAKAEQTAGGQQMDAIRQELAEWERRRSEFLAERIVLDS